LTDFDREAIKDKSYRPTCPRCLDIYGVKHNLVLGLSTINSLRLHDIAEQQFGINVHEILVNWQNGFPYDKYMIGGVLRVLVVGYWRDDTMTMDSRMNRKYSSLIVVRASASGSDGDPNATAQMNYRGRCPRDYSMSLIRRDGFSPTRRPLTIYFADYSWTVRSGVRDWIVTVCRGLRTPHRNLRWNSWVLYCGWSWWLQSAGANHCFVMGGPKCI